SSLHPTDWPIMRFTPSTYCSLQALFLLFCQYTRSTQDSQLRTIHSGSVHETQALQVRAQEQAGPHGTLVLPKGGKRIRNVGGLAVLHIKYTKYSGNDGETLAIDLLLRPNDEGRANYLVLANGLTSSSNDPHITAHFNSRWACGTYKLVVREHQFYKGVHISFQVAAPTIKVTCVPV
ncbi:hypothetical protein O181_064701, partial [Austropuccinia psidii MF-1]|nr:hypothetical protein [Austropuccinia psidii MF-1]